MAVSVRRSASRRKVEKVDKKTAAQNKPTVLRHELIATAWLIAAMFITISFLQVWQVAGQATQLGQPITGSFGVIVGGAFARVFGLGTLALAAWLGWLGVRALRTARGAEVSPIQRPVLAALGGALLLVFGAFLAAALLPQTGGLVATVGLPFIQRTIGLAGAIVLSASALVLSLALACDRGVSGIVADFGRTMFLALRFFVQSIVFVFMLALEMVLLIARTSTRVFESTVGLLAGRQPKVVQAAAVAPLPPPRRRKNTISTEQTELPLEAPADSDGEMTHVVVNRRALGAKEKKNAPARAAAAPTPVTPNEPTYASYKAPSVELLLRQEESVGAEDDSVLLEKSRQIEAKLKDFGIQGRVTEVHPGPVITLFEFEPAAGVKVGRIAALQDDLAMSLRATSIRIIAPIPRKGTVGIEVPNKNRDIVRLRDVIESEAFQTSDSTLSVAIGKDTYGDPVVVDIATMPHLLLAGATGTGKSVCINTLLLSLLYRASPAELGLILIDPKILELSVYEGVPHLRVPVVTVPKQARAVLDWAAKEMDRRYRMMQRFGVRNIDGYNRIVRGERDIDPKDKAALAHEVIVLREEQVVQAGTVEARGEAEAAQSDVVPIVEELKPLPKLVIVIDELADLMLTVGREIEELITRLAQKARAAGIHLIVATQRPSVDVITGLIKANFPARLSFRVVSRIDSRTILDSMGAEKLLGRGDMLFQTPGAHALKRVHGAFVSDAEVKRVIEAIRAQCPPSYDARIVEVCERALAEEATSADGGGNANGVEEYDLFYDKAVEMVVHKGQASTSMIQRHFRIGYNRAARIIEMMERDGVIGPMDGVKPREVLLPPVEE